MFFYKNVFNFKNLWSKTTINVVCVCVLVHILLFELILNIYELLFYEYIYNVYYGFTP